MGRLHEALRKAEQDRTRVASPHTGAETADKAAASPRAPAAPATAAPASGGAAAASSTPGARSGVDPHLVVISDPGSPLAEQYRGLRAGMLAAASAQAWKVWLVTSSAEGEGKSITAANLAAVLSEQQDRNVVLVDADLRRGAQHRLFSVDNQRGLSDYLAGGTMLEMALQRSPLSNLWVLPAGRPPTNPAELLTARRMDDLLGRLRREFDVVLMDTPAVGEATDAAVLAPRADGTLLVVRMGATRRESARQAVNLLRDAKANLVGTVLTGYEGTIAAS